MRRHPIDGVSLMFGLGFTALGTAWFAGLIDERYLTIGWLGPVLLILSGVAVIATLASPDPAAAADDGAPRGRAAESGFDEGIGDDTGTARERDGRP